MRFRRHLLAACVGVAAACDGSTARTAPAQTEPTDTATAAPAATETRERTRATELQRCEVPERPSARRTVDVVFTCDERPVAAWRAPGEERVDVLAYALHALLEGPTEDERARGLTSFFSAQTAGMLNRAVIVDGVARIDFADFSGIIPNASTSAGSAQLLEQLAGTIFQFEHVAAAEIGFDGSCDAFWNWLQRGCQRLTRDAQ